MRDVNRIYPLLIELGGIWSKYPDLRLGQLILNVIQDPALYHIEDDRLIEVLKEGYGIE